MGRRKLVRGATPVLIAILATVGTNYYLRSTPYFTLAPLFAILAMGIYHGGITSGIIIALLIGAYGFYASPNLIRAGIIALSLLLIVGPIAVLRRRIDNVNTILARLRHLDAIIAGTELRWPHLTEKEKRDLIREIQHHIAHILTLTLGWHELALEREALLDDYVKDKEG